LKVKCGAQLYSEAAKAYREEVLRRGSNVFGDDILYGIDPYQKRLKRQRTYSTVTAMDIR
jgi:hypothetical protein